eukprot:6462571-Amphidinium_carterae.1
MKTNRDTTHTVRVGKTLSRWWDVMQMGILSQMSTECTARCATSSWTSALGSTRLNRTKWAEGINLQRGVCAPPPH